MPAAAGPGRWHPAFPGPMTRGASLRLARLSPGSRPRQGPGAGAAGGARQNRGISIPPSIGKECPVEYGIAPDASVATAPPISSASPQRRIGDEPGLDLRAVAVPHAARHVGADHARLDVVGVDAVGREPHREQLRHHRHAGLGHAVFGAVQRCHHRIDRGDEHQRAMPAHRRAIGQHPLRHRLAEEEDAARVDVEQPVPGIRRRLQHVLARLHLHAGDIGEAFEPAIGPPGGIEQHLMRADVADIGQQEGEAAAGCLHRGPGLLGALGRDVGANQVEPLLRQGDAAGAAYPAPRAGDECGRLHCISLSGAAAGGVRPLQHKARPAIWRSGPVTVDRRRFLDVAPN